MLMNVFAQEIEIGGAKIEGPLNDNIDSVGALISTILNFIYPLAGLILLVMLIWGGYSFMTSGGDPEKVQRARGVLTSSIIGFVLLILSFFIVRVIAFIFGLDGGLLFQ